MGSLEIEGLSKTMDPISPAGPGGGAGRVLREMRDNGMDQNKVGGGVTFSDILNKSVDQVNEYQLQADHATKELIAGRTKNIHETMLTVERADMALKLMVQVRNKILDAYREIMRMQV